MPELPEVETVKRQISSLQGAVITEAKLLWHNTCPSLPADIFSKTLQNRTLRNFRRRGKYLIIDLDGLYLISHFRMTGTFILAMAADEAPPHARAVFKLSNGSILYFNDPRKFGRILVCENEEQVLENLGVEPFDETFTPPFLQKMCAGSRKPIKSLLLEQHNVCGIGNMYADEALFLSGILPQTSAGVLSETQCLRLHDAIINALQSGIDHQGATISDYKMPDGSKGRAQDYFYVAHRLNKPCKNCSSTIRRTVIGGRGTYYCAYCQS